MATLTTACAAIPSPRPVKPRPSLVVALMLTRSDADPEHLGGPRRHRRPVRVRSSAARRRSPGRRSRPGRPARARRFAACRRNCAESASRQRCVAGREVAADVASRDRAEDGVGDRRGTRRRRRNGRQGRGRAGRHAAQDQRPIGGEGVDVEAQPRAPARPGASSRSATSRSSGRVSLRLRSSPATQPTARPGRGGDRGVVGVGGVRRLTVRRQDRRRTGSPAASARGPGRSRSASPTTTSPDEPFQRVDHRQRPAGRPGSAPGRRAPGRSPRPIPAVAPRRGSALARAGWLARLSRPARTVACRVAPPIAGSSKARPAVAAAYGRDPPRR